MARTEGEVTLVNGYLAGGVANEYCKIVPAQL